MARMFGSSQKEQAELLKDQGNSYFKKEKLGAAIEAYTQVFYLPPCQFWYLGWSTLTVFVNVFGSVFGRLLWMSKVLVR